MEDASTLSGRLVELRERAGYSQRAVAAGTGIPRATYERREVNARLMTWHEMCAIAKFYGIKLSDLVEPADGEPIGAVTTEAAA